MCVKKIWLLSKKDEGYTKWETRMWNVSEYLHDPAENRGELHELVELSFAEWDLILCAFQNLSFVSKR